MSATKATNGTWTSRFYYTNYTGERKQAFKRGFKTKKEALEYERDYLAKAEFNVTMKFESLIELYLEDIAHRIKPTTLILRKRIVRNKIIPYFKNFQINEITPITIRNFHNKLITEDYSQTYLKLVGSTLSSVFAFAVNFYKLPENPCIKAGSIGKLTSEKEMQIWTIEEFKLVSQIAKDNRYDIYIILNILFFTGIRIGELLALTLEDINFDKKIIKINKTLVRIDGENVSTTTKTEAGRRDILVNDKLLADISSYSKKIYELNKTNRLFQIDRTNVSKQIKKFATLAGVKEIRIHDLRHSHASLLIHLGVNPLAISKRLGHEKVDTTLNVYSHLYPNASEKIVEMLENL
ncbi:MAG: site-specific integrase [Cetobacterium sp.]